MNDAGKRIKEHYADTGGFTDHVFAMCALLGYQFAPRLRNLSSLDLYGMSGITLPKIMQEGVPLDMAQNTTNLVLDSFSPNNFCFAKIPKTHVFGTNIINLNF